MEDYTIKKTTVECYKIRHPKKDAWADITIDTDGGKEGRIQIASDFGDWQYFWGAAGPSFKEFLCKISIDYVASKFGADRWFDLDQTLKDFNKLIDECGMDDEWKKKAYEEVKSFELNSSSKDEFYFLVMECKRIMEVCDERPEVSHSINPLFVRFWNELWPVFINEMKKEISVEKVK